MVILNGVGATNVDGIKGLFKDLMIAMLRTTRWKSCGRKWTTLSTYFLYSQEIRTLINMSDAIENTNRQLRKVTASKSVFPPMTTFLKMLYLATIDITRKWSARPKGWRIFHAKLEIFLEDQTP